MNRPGSTSDATTLLVTGGAIWVTNVIAFALWYWEFDRGGPVARALAIKPYPDFEFPQMTSPELAPPSWEPMFGDYFYLSFTNATAFSPTDVLPLSRWGQDAHAGPVGGFAAPGGPGHRQGGQHPPLSG